MKELHLTTSITPDEWQAQPVAVHKLWRAARRMKWQDRLDRANLFQVYKGFKAENQFSDEVFSEAWRMMLEDFSGEKHE
jgi:hypothetical protein